VTPVDNIEARLIALEMLFRAMLTGMVSRCRDPMAEVDRMRDEFLSTSTFLRVGDGDERAERMRELIVARVNEIFDAINGRLLHDVHIEAAHASKN
jgi:hypothetical protein